MVIIVLQPVCFSSKTASLYYKGKVLQIKTFLREVNENDFHTHTSMHI
jgi:hypothetical protein